MNELPWLKLPGMAGLWIGMFVAKIVVAAAGLVAVPFMWQHRNTDYKLVREYHKWTRPFLNVEDWYGQPYHWGNSLPQWWIDQFVKKEFDNWYDRPFNWIKKAVQIGYDLFKDDEPYPSWTAPAPFLGVSRGAGFLSFYQYHAIRNPANGLRSIDPIRLEIDLDEVDYVTNVGDYEGEKRGTFEPGFVRKSPLKWVGYFAWQGWYSGMKFVYVWNDTHHLVIKLGWRVEPADVVPLPQGKSDQFYADQKILRANRSFAMKVGLHRKG